MSHINSVSTSTIERMLIALLANRDADEYLGEIAAEEEQLESDDCSMCEVPIVDGCVRFKDAGVLTNNSGLILYLSDGAEFQITIVRSR